MNKAEAEELLEQFNILFPIDPRRKPLNASIEVSRLWRSALFGLGFGMSASRLLDMLQTPTAAEECRWEDDGGAI